MSEVGRATRLTDEHFRSKGSGIWQDAYSLDVSGLDEAARFLRKKTRELETHALRVWRIICSPCVNHYRAPN